MSKRIYRSLFDSDDVFEVEEVKDNPDISTEGVAATKQDSGEEVKEEKFTLEDCGKAIKALKDEFTEFKKQFEKKDNIEPAGGDKVTKQEPVIDGDDEIVEEGAQTEDAFCEECGKEVGDEEPKEGDTAQAVKDAYSKFTKVNDSKSADPRVATQVAFQKRYDSVANK